MPLTIQPILEPAERLRYIRFAWQVNRGDCHWVPPLIADRLAKLDPCRNPFWQTAEQALWMVSLDGHPAGTITAILDHRANETLGEPLGTFGFFECSQDPACSRILFDTAASWLAGKGCRKMRGPYNPSPSDETGILVEGFDTRPCLLMGHNPPYYSSLFEKYGFIKYNDVMARLWQRPAGARSLADTLPEKLLRVAEKAGARSDLRIRPIDLQAWDEEIKMACRIYNQALNDLPDYIPISEAEFYTFAATFKLLVDPKFTLVAEIGGTPVGFALALPDINEALLHVDGRLDWLGLAKLWWYSRRLRRISFKILMLLPEYQNRGIEAVLGMQIARQLWDAGYQEVDLSLTGEENVKSTRFQEHLGFQIYRRYRIYEKGL